MTTVTVAVFIPLDFDLKIFVRCEFFHRFQRGVPFCGDRLIDEQTSSFLFVYHHYFWSVYYGSNQNFCILYTIKYFDRARERSPLTLVKTWYKYVYLKSKLYIKISNIKLLRNKDNKREN